MFNSQVQKQQHFEQV
ncbi:hypothetical protein HID58_089336 [Brassica napus]|uniref:Uncharacterized protein n=1 Tax=Brassica napus TaxID=3708 RepID=A0ABQ7Y1S8_BRANA|nr:hypothetical protein HID58_089336 [Brassica napus]